MCRVRWIAVFGLAMFAVASPAANAQQRPYIGYVYPAGGQRGTTFEVRVGGQYLDGVSGVYVSGGGVRGEIADYLKRLGTQEMALLREQLTEIRRGLPRGQAPKNPETQAILARIERRITEYVQTPANAGIADLVMAKITIAPDAQPGRRELRLVTLRGISNPVVFYVGQLPEFTRKAMLTTPKQILGKEEQALRKRPPEEEEVQVTVPCTTNGQVASGEVNRYRFEARKGQRLLIALDARVLNPYIADAVPGWFQPVLTVRDEAGREMAFCDDYRFRPDPIVFFEVPHDGTYEIQVNDAIYRGREDFVYRLTIGELPFVTGIFPLGGRAGENVKFQTVGWNLALVGVTPPPKDAGPGVYRAAAGRSGFISNHLPIVLDTLPEAYDREPNNDRTSAQKVQLPVIINGRIDRPGDWDVFAVQGRAGDTLVAEVSARRLESPVDSMLKLTDAAGNVLAANDDTEDPAAGINTHHADSYIMFKLPADGTYYVHLGDTAHGGGPDFAYRLRLSPPRPDFTLFVVPSSVAMRSRGTATVNVQVFRKDGFAGPVTVALKDPPTGFSVSGGTIAANQTSGRLTIGTALTSTKGPVALRLEGRAKVADGEIVRRAIAAEDRMQAFLWRHLVPAEDLVALVYDPSYNPPPKRVPPVAPPPATVAQARPPTAGGGTQVAAGTPATPATTAPSSSTASTAPKPAFSKAQVAGRLRQLKFLYEEGLLTDGFYLAKVAECEAAQ